MRLSDGSVVYDVAQSREGIRVASVKLLFPHYLAAGHLDGTVGLWGFNDSKQFQHHELVGHGGTIFSLDGDLVTGHDLNNLHGRRDIDNISRIWTC